MMGLIGKKIGMTQIFDTEGNCIPVTVVKAGPCPVTQVKTPGTDRYAAIQLGYDKIPERKLNQPRKGHLKKNGVEPYRFLREFRMKEDEIAQFVPGQEIDVNIFKPGDAVDVTGNSKGKGFTGVMKRHNFHGFRATHGTHECFRHGGSIGCRTPQHTIKGRKMAGRSGGSKVTTQNLKIVEVRDKDNLILIKGAVPGSRNSLLLIQKAIKKQVA